MKIKKYINYAAIYATALAFSISIYILLYNHTKANYFPCTGMLCEFHALAYLIIPAMIVSVLGPVAIFSFRNPKNSSIYAFITVLTLSASATGMHILYIINAYRNFTNSVSFGIFDIVLFSLISIIVIGNIVRAVRIIRQRAT